MTDFDVAIVGARVAGSVLATHLGEAGHRVLLIDATRFPSDTISTHFFRGAGLGSVLVRLGLIDAVLGLGSPPLTREYNFRDADPVPSVDPPQDPGDLGYCLSVRRLALDALLVDRARGVPAVTVVEGARVRDLVRDRGRVSGVVLERDGRREEIRSRLVVGADGRSSLIARLVAAPVERREIASRAMYFRYLRGFRGPEGSWDGPEFSLVGDELLYAFPSDDDVTCLAVSVNLEVFGQSRRDPVRAFDARVSRHPGLASRYRAATAEGRLLGSGPVDAVVRTPFGPGWALAGDASMSQDPWTGLGMDNAGIHAGYLAEAIDGWLSGAVTEGAAFTGYRARRDEHALEDFEETAMYGRDLSKLP